MLLIHVDERAVEIARKRVVEALASGANREREAHDRVPVDAGHVFGPTYAAAVHQAAKHLKTALGTEIVRHGLHSPGRVGHPSRVSGRAPQALGSVGSGEGDNLVGARFVMTL